VWRYFQDKTNLESHFIIGLDGRIIQAIDTEHSADANFHANLRPDGTGAVSIETCDNGDPDNFKWTDAQVFSLVRLHRWLGDVHNIPARQCRTPEDPGHGYHTLFGAPSEWTPVAKSCPGKIRKVQWHQVLLPAYIENTEDDLTPEQDARLKNIEAQLAGLETSVVNRLAKYTWDSLYRIALVLKTGKSNTFFNPVLSPALFESDTSLEKIDAEVDPEPQVPPPPSP
jgi:N-acetylmuramoyl-L-alanine amidase